MREEVREEVMGIDDEEAVAGDMRDDRPPLWVDMDDEDGWKLSPPSALGDVI